MNNSLKTQLCLRVAAGTKRPLEEIDESPAKRAQMAKIRRPTNSKHKFILKWLECIDSNQDTRDSNGFTTPTMPSTGTPNPQYRRLNLAANGIHLMHPCDPTPEHITNFVNQIRRDRDSPGPSAGEILQDRQLHDLSLGAPKSEVEKYFLARIFSDPEPCDDLKRNETEPMLRRNVPSTGFNLKVSTPVPGALYGYKKNAFGQHRRQLWSMREDVIANSQGLILPFLIVEFLGDDGSMWAATNRCMGGSASCVNMVEKLNRRLKHRTNEIVDPTNSAAFSIAMSGTEARLYVSWKQDEKDYHMANVDNFLLQNPEHYARFYRHVRNIINWGQGERLEGIRKSLEGLSEES